MSGPVSATGRRQAEYRAWRCLVDGRLVSFHPDCPHGRRTGYSYYACRCLDCAATERAYRAELRARPVPRELHGTVTGRANRRCGCADCVSTLQDYDAERYATRPMARLNKQQRRRRRSKQDPTSVGEGHDGVDSSRNNLG